MKTIFNTPVIRDVLCLLARLIMRLIRWKVVGETPAYDKCVLIAAPHTSNWDFPYMLCTILSRRMEVRWMGKQQLFSGPFGGIMKWLGGIPIERSKTNNTVDEMAKAFLENDKLTLLITPEGTRSKVKEWKTGFYHIAVAAKVPIVQGFLDSSIRSCGFGPSFHPTGDTEQDIAKIKDFYKNMLGVRPELGVSTD